MQKNKQSENKTLFLCSLGGAFEFYDFSLFAIMTPIISTHFFDTSEPNLALIKSYGIFATGYLARFLGGFYFSHLGDTTGRKKPFMWTLFLMALPTLSIAFLPTYQQIGIIAPLLLILLRIIQGFAMGGEAPCAMAYIHEYAAPQKQSFSMSILFGGILLGSFFASFLNFSLNFFLSKEDFSTWGWRIPFIFGGVLGLLGIYLRKSLQESKDFIKCKNENKLTKVPFFNLIQQNLPNVGRGILILLPSATAFLYFLILSSTMLQKEYQFAKVDLERLVTVGLLTNSFFCFIFGYLSDKFTSKKIYLLGISTLFILTLFSQYIFSTNNITALSIYIIFISVTLGCCVGSVFNILANLFSTHNRTSAIALCMNTTNGLFIGLTPMLFTEMMIKTELKSFPAIYIGVLCLIAFSVMYKFENKRKNKARH